MIKAWEAFFGEEENVTIMNGDLTTVSCDAIVSPANSFGFMDGGVDYAISLRLGWGFQLELQRQIKALPEGELLVGRSLILETGDELIPYLVSSPTMRVPMDFNISTSINAYLAMKGTLITVNDHPKINTVAIPGFCTGVGKMDVNIAAKQMYKAFKEVVKGERMSFNHYEEAQEYHLEINEKGKVFH